MPEIKIMGDSLRLSCGELFGLDYVRNSDEG